MIPCSSYWIIIPLSVICQPKTFLIRFLLRVHWYEAPLYIFQHVLSLYITNCSHCDGPKRYSGFYAVNWSWDIERPLEASKEKTQNDSMLAVMWGEAWVLKLVSSHSKSSLFLTKFFFQVMHMNLRHSPGGCDLPYKFCINFNVYKFQLRTLGRLKKRLVETVSPKMVVTNNVE